MSPAFTPTDLLAAASSALESGGYARVAEDRLNGWQSGNGRLYEDAYGVVAIIVFETWSGLRSGWTNAQATLVELMSEYLGKEDAKAWEGYLVLLTPGEPDLETGVDERESIRYDTSRVRKLVATGEELGSLLDVERVLLPVLPLNGQAAVPDPERSILDLLPELLASDDVDPEAVSALIDAFQKQRPLLEALHSWRAGQ